MVRIKYKGEELLPVKRDLVFKAVFEKAVKKLVYVSADEQLCYELDMREKAELDYWSAMKTNYDKGIQNQE